MAAIWAGSHCVYRGPVGYGGVMHFEAELLERLAREATDEIVERAQAAIHEDNRWVAAYSMSLLSRLGLEVGLNHDRQEVVEWWLAARRGSCSLSEYLAMCETREQLPKHLRRVASRVNEQSFPRER